MIRILLCVIATFMACLQPASADIVINGFTDQANDRFTNDASFIASGFDLSGIGRGAGDAPIGSETPTQTRWGTLISSNVVITANHFPAAAGRPNDTLSFYRNNDPNDVVIRTLESSQRIGGTDLHLAVLDLPVPADIAVYNFISDELNEEPFNADTNSIIYDAGSVQNAEAYLFGISPTDRPDSETRIDQAVGRNRITGYVENFPFNGLDNDLLLLEQDPSGGVPFEARFSPGDSGAPLFIEQNGELLLLGVNSALLTGDSQFSGVAYIGNETEQINAFILANAVPEPSSLSTIFLIGVVWVSRRRKL